ncbi:adhesin [Escherichia coli]|nr:adhesin [Escherichia coli]MBS9009112.1 adhesin [Escherichia coli]
MENRIPLFLFVVSLLLISGGVYAEKLNISVQKILSGELLDETKIATGRIVCQNSHSGFHIWMTSRQEGNSSNRYIIQGKNDSRNEIRIKLDGYRWSSFMNGESQGIVRLGNESQSEFYILIDGNQSPVPDEYVFSVKGACISIH